MHILKHLTNRRLLNCYKDSLCIRTLFAPESTGIDKYKSYRELALSHEMDLKKFRLEFKGKLEQDVSVDILITNTRRHLHLIDGSHVDIDLLRRALRLFLVKNEQTKTQNQVNPQKDFVFGPLVMRALSYLTLPNVAMQFFQDENIGQLFYQPISYQILLDLLYEEKMYEDVLRMYAIIVKKMDFEGMPLSPPINAIIFATYYRLNTPEHCELAFALYNRLKAVNQHKDQFRKSMALVGAMKLRRNLPNECLEILSIHDDGNFECRFVQMLAFACLNKFDEVFRLIQLTISPSQAEQQKFGNTTGRLPDNLLQQIETKLKEFGDEKKLKEYSTIFNKLVELDRIYHKSLDDTLCARFPSKVLIYSPYNTKQKYQIQKKRSIKNP